MPTLNFSTSRMEWRFRLTDGRLSLRQVTAGGHSWLHPEAQSGLFSLTVDESEFDAADLTLIGIREETNQPGVQRLIFSFKNNGLAVDYFLNLYQDTALAEGWPVIRNLGQRATRISQIDSINLHIQTSQPELLAFTGNWGSEFEPVHAPLKVKTVLESRSGRSSKGNHPWFALFDRLRGVLSASAAWSGNWALRLEPTHIDSWQLSGGLNDWEFSKLLQPGESLQGAPVVLVFGEDLDAVSQQYASVGRKHWYPQNDLSSILPVEWNHWWPYEDVEINETVFAENVVRAREMGFEVCTLDAGWFGPSDPGTFWEHYRGDWHLVNQQRFPGGIRKVSDHVHAHGMKFGIWCEIEGLGMYAQVARDHPEYVAQRDGTSLGGMCFGNPQVREWAYATLSGLIEMYQCDWIKVDFNLDLGAGCNRSDHGHQEGDGLYEHVQGYYQVLEQVRQQYPEVVLENCSSGGLRIDLGSLRRTYMVYLSDPDWPDHDLQIFWGASTMLAPNVLLHWTFSHWRNTNPPPYQTFDPHDPGLTVKKWEYYARTSMLGLFGISQKLPLLPKWLAKRISQQIDVYKKHVRRFIKEADLFRLTSQPRRNGEGERWAAFQYSLPDRSEHLLFVFRLPGGETGYPIRLKALQPEKTYHILGLEGEYDFYKTGHELMEKGLVFPDLAEEESALVKIQ